MKKMKRLSLVLSVLIALSMLLAACAPAATQAPAAATEAPAKPAATEAPAAATEAPAKQVLNVWSFTNEIRTMAIAFQGKHPDVQVNYTMIPMTNGEYQTKVKAAAGTKDSPDVVALEAAFVKEWVESDILADQSDLVPLTKDLKTYPAVVQVGTNDGVAKAFSYQATPGAFFYRRSIAKECLGTDDPAKVQEMVADMTKFVETAAKIKACGTKDYYMVGTGAELFTPFLSNRAQPWVVDGKMVIDPKVEEYIKFAKLMRDEGYESGATQWSEGWFAGMNDSLKDAKGTPKKIFSYFLPTWGLPYVLSPHAKTEDGKNDTSGDWAMVNGPLSYQWGGTWVGGLDKSPNAALAKEFIKFVALDEENLTNWATGVYTNEYLKKIDPTTPDDQKQDAGDFVSSQLVVEKITKSFDKSTLADFLGGENSYGAFAAAAPSVNGALMTGSDDAIQRALNDPRDAYLSGKITEAEMYKQWLDAVANEFPDLVLPEPPVK
jgi:ABC-type glycerol-3-phosphate transport system substrate-binding protein